MNLSMSNEHLVMDGAHHLELLHLLFFLTPCDLRGQDLVHDLKRVSPHIANLTPPCFFFPQISVRCLLSSVQVLPHLAVPHKASNTPRLDPPGHTVWTWPASSGLHLHGGWTSPGVPTTFSLTSLLLTPTAGFTLWCEIILVPLWHTELQQYLFLICMVNETSSSFPCSSVRAILSVQSVGIYFN